MAEACKELMAVAVGWVEEAEEGEEEGALVAAADLTGGRLWDLRPAVALVVGVGVGVGKEGLEPPALQPVTRSARVRYKVLGSSCNSNSSSRNCRKGRSRESWGQHQRKQREQLRREVWDPTRTSRRRGGVQGRGQWAAALALLKPRQLLLLSRQQEGHTRVALPMLLALVQEEQQVEGQEWCQGRMRRMRSWGS